MTARDTGCGDAAPYVLGALDDHEEPIFVAHIATCAVCRDEVASLKVAADALALAVTPVLAPPHLRDRVMHVVERDARLLVGRPAESASRTRRRWLGGLAPVPLATAVAALAAAVVVAVTAGGPDRASPRLIAATVNDSPVRAVLADYGTRAELRISHLRPAGPGRIYEVWVQRHGVPQPTDSLFDANAAGSASAAVPASLRGVQAVMVTAEPRGGSRVPTSTPVLVASLT